MAVYEYEAKQLNGTVLKGKMEALDDRTVRTILRNKHLFPVVVKEYSKYSNIDLSQFQKVTLKDLTIFCNQFSFIISAGISIMRALEIVKEQIENKKLSKILSLTNDDVQKGKTFSEALGKHKDIPQMLINMIEVGEASGTLDTILEKMAAYYEKELKQQQKIKAALTYPAVICVVAILVVNLLVIKVLPTFAGMITQSGGGELPLPTKIVMGLSGFMINYWMVIVVAVILISIGFKKYSATYSGKILFDRLKMNMPILGKIYNKIVTARFARTFGILMGCGVPLLESISICANVVGNTIVKNKLISCSEEIKKGGSIGIALEERKVFPVMLTQMIKIGEESGTLDQVLQKTAEFYDNEIDNTTGQLTAMIEPLIIVVLGVVVGFIIISIILPMFQMYDAVGKQ